MQKQTAEALVGRYLYHTIFGNIYVKEVLSAKEDKIRGVVESSGEEKTFVISSNYFSDPNGTMFKKKFEEKPVRKKVKAEIDYKKYRNHPLVKQIDKKENYSSKLYTTRIDEDSNDDSLSDEESK
ncbi:hypothetical protein CI105_09140 [Candidatus Izimaplasma bacterium ZiA1]|uniref:hypothetical protein n=1 Tax=Candidatus Izimoplasma sp. ZiA1 TaxID=2024899 RepID=UPI000BAA7DD6|nr:hypothetical protein CI105_09140 [Candidatus Izimaplasma bacterium ZiA1]